VLAGIQNKGKARLSENPQTGRFHCQQGMPGNHDCNILSQRNKLWYMIFPQHRSQFFSCDQVNAIRFSQNAGFLRKATRIFAVK
jgi:hypothetical protein